MSDQPALSLRQQFLTLPNLLSMLRLALVPVFLTLLINSHFYSAILVLALASLTDYLDGFFARRWNQVTRLGQLLDPAADRLYIFSTLVGLAIAGIIPYWLMWVIIARDVVLAVAYVVLANHGYGPLPVHFLGKVATFSLLYAFPLLLMAEIWPLIAWLLPLAWAFALWGVGLYWWAGFVYLRQVRSIVKNDPIEVK
ncbi:MULTISPECIES: CDP-alcohol phosphatidyltransferase family protein [Rhodoluna]|jgi:cardiolipin synthase (CMP-forming)|uniref:CDP-alcohol phosphatidyltransferase family protein n=1 Tax=Rhodoluna TaxID=529883 RepID=UPI001105F2A3|nr:MULTISPECIES: CDP-alcohol phosphatidyltransferase family protein [Rhodoluna]BDS48896.1 CDP-diacylglycerol--glycerol-3-phosphate 3-phosphatidyltransferase [Rhodoluna sp. KAS3]